MVQGYYTLPEAAQVLGMNPDELKQMAQKKEIRSFQDRGTLRFRIQDIQELGRRRGSNSEPDLVLGEAPPVTPKVAPKSDASRRDVGPRTPAKHEGTAGEGVFDFSLDIDDKVDIGQEVLSDLPGGSKKSGLKGPGSSRKSALRSPSPKPGSDSDVKLVGAGDAPASDSGVKIVGQDSDVKRPETGKTPTVARKSGLGSASPTPKKSSRLGGAAQPADSGVRLVPLDSDSNVKIAGTGSEDVGLGAPPPTSASDSDIRLEKYTQPPPAAGAHDMLLTEEINLDEEIRKQEAALRQQPQAKLKPKSKLRFPTTSPFELSESDIDRPSGAGSKPGSKELRPDSSDIDLLPGALKDDSSDIDLTPADSGSVVLQPDQNDDFSLELPDDSALGGDMSALSGPSSGISLENPVDAGISLEEGGADASDADFDLSLEVEATPKPAPAAGAADSESGFELSLDADDSSGQQPAVGTDDSDSEFELTLDDSGSLSPLDSEVPAPQLKADSEEKDIFETDFEVPALEDDSGSQVAALDTDLDSSDFDIALDDSAVEEDESQSQVVALDEEADEAATTRAGVEVEVEVEEGGEAAGFGDLDVGAAEEDEVAEVDEDVDDAKTVVKEKLVGAAPWGPLPVVFMLPCVVVMVLVGLLGFELVQSAGGYKSPGFLTKAISEMIGSKIK
jgi:hypothetical protein